MRLTLTITCNDNEDPGQLMLAIENVLPDTAEVDDWDAIK